MRFWLALSVVVLSVLLFGERLALAQTVTLQTAGITRVNADGSMVTTKSTTNMNVFQRTNAADCYGLDDKGIEYAFPVSVAMETMPAAHHIEVWAGGSDCTPLTSRSGTTPICWPVSASTYPPNSTVQSIRIRAQDIVSQITNTTKTLTYSAAQSNVCTLTTALSTVTVYFLLLDGTSNPVGTGAAWAMKIKLIGPAPPDPVDAEGLNNTLRVGWTSTNSQQDADLAGYKVFVDSGGVGDGSTTTADASGTPVTTCADGGTDDAGNVLDGGCTTTIVYDASSNGGGGTCSSATLTSGGNAAKLTEAATAPGKTATSANIDGLSNGSSYAVAVAAYDAYDNVGPLSNVVCASPEPIQDFWTNYKNAGGGAGGFCTIEGGPFSGSAIGLGLAFVAIAIARRRKR